MGHDRFSKAKYQSEIEQSGGINLIVHTFDKFYDWYNAIFSNNNS